MKEDREIHVIVTGNGDLDDWDTQPYAGGQSLIHNKHELIIQWYGRI